MKAPKILVFAFILVICAGYSVAVSIGISPGRVKFENVLKEGYSERTVAISTGADEDLIGTFKPQGDIKDWLKFEPNSTEFRASKGSPYKLKIILQPPPDARIGNYSGSIEFIAEGAGGQEGRAGTFVKTAVTLLVNTEITGNELVNCRAGAFSFNDVEVGFPFELSYTVINDGNVKLNPPIDLDVWDQAQEKLLLTKEIVGNIVLPTTEKKITKALPNTLSEGQYWASMKVDECKSSSLLTFSVVEKGGIADKGELTEILNKPWAYTNETVQFTAKFQNTGKRSVTAKFKGAIRLDDKIVRLIETEEVIVPVGEESDFDVFFTPELPGRYTLSGRVVYNKKLTFEKGTVLNINPAPEQAAEKKQPSLPLLIYVTIIITILFVMRKIMKGKKNKRAF